MKGRNRAGRHPRRKSLPTKKLRRIASSVHLLAAPGGVAGAAAVVSIKYTSASEGFEAWIDGTKLTLGDGEASLKVANGVHYLYWLAWGQPDAVVEMKIVAPEEAKFSYKDAIGPDFKNFWHHRFHVGSE